MGPPALRLTRWPLVRARSVAPLRSWFRSLYSFDGQWISALTGIRTPRRSTSITIPNRIDKIDSELSLDASDFPRLSFGL